MHFRSDFLFAVRSCAQVHVGIGGDGERTLEWPDRASRHRSRHCKIGDSRIERLEAMRICSEIYRASRVLRRVPGSGVGGRGRIFTTLQRPLCMYLEEPRHSPVLDTKVKFILPSSIILVPTLLYILPPLQFSTISEEPCLAKLSRPWPAAPRFRRRRPPSPDPRPRSHPTSHVPPSRPSSRAASSHKARPQQLRGPSQQHHQSWYVACTVSQ